MPTAPLRYCTAPRCSTKVPAGRCPAHAAPASQGWQGTARYTGTTRIRGRKLQYLRAELFAAEPFCRVCTFRLADIRDHIIPLAEGGTDDLENIQPLCQDCSDAKTHAEAARGTARWARGGG